MRSGAISLANVYFFVCSVLDNQLSSDEVDVSSMILLAKKCDKLMENINEQFRMYYRAQIDGRQSPSSPVGRARAYSSHTLINMRELSFRRRDMVVRGYNSNFSIGWQVDKDCRVRYHALF